MEGKNLLTSGNGKYGRAKAARINKHACDVCQQEKDVISFDSSDFEYSTISICKECFNKLLS